MRIVKTRFLFVALLLFAHGAYAADGIYQRTKDGKTRVWNVSPKPGDAATWSGDRDGEGYATGYGTITWYKGERKPITGFRLPPVRYVPSVHYSGKMVRGKLQGTVDTAEHGKPFHAKFADGIRVGRWAAGPGPTPNKPAEEPARRAELVEAAPAPAEAPKPVPQASPSPSEEPAKPAVAKTKDQPDISEPAASREKSSGEMDDSLRELVGPPSLLREKTEGASQTAAMPSAQPAAPALTAMEVIGLANAEARARGVDLEKYQRPQAHYVATGDSWSVVYEENADANGISATGKRVNITVEDKTKKASVVTEQ